VGIGLDAGEAVAVEGGYRGGALNLAARLCAQAKAGEVLASEAVIHLAAKVDGLAYVDPRTLKLKGYDRPVRAVDVVSSDSVPGGFSHRMHRASDRVRADRRIQAAIAVVLCLALAAAVLPPVLRDDASAAGNPVDPGLAFLDASTGDQVNDVDLAWAGSSFFAEGLFWVRDSDNSVFLAIDPATHEVVERIPVPFPGYATVEGSRLWVAAQQDPRVVAIDIPSERIIVDRDLAQDPEDTLGMSGILAAEDSIWVQHDNALFRLDQRNGEEQAKIEDVYWAGGLAQADDGTIWATSWPGLVQIDPATNERTDLEFDRQTEIYGSVVSEGGALWTADEIKGELYKIDPATAAVLDTYDTDEGSRYLSADDGQVWVANQDVGTVMRFDAVTGAGETFPMGHLATAVVAGAGQAMVTVWPLRTVEAEIDALEGSVARVLVPGYAFNELDPAVAPYAGDPLAHQLANATCARLLRYPDDPDASSWEMVPEVATGPPEVSADGRTYTFTIADGFAFSPPSNEAITAETYAFSLERALSPVFGAEAQGPWYIDDIRGLGAYRDGRSDHIAGVRAEGDTLSITLVAPSETFLQRLAGPPFCPVPLDSPIVAGGVTDYTGVGLHIPPLASAGPYYVSYHLNGELTILRRNPNYVGDRPGTIDAIAMREGVDPPQTIGRVEGGAWDLTLVGDGAMDPGGALDQAWGPGSDAAAAGDQRYYDSGLTTTATIALNAGRPLFADERVRRAVAAAIDRAQLASHWDGYTATDVLVPDTVAGGLRGADPTPAGDPEAGRALMDGAAGGTAIMGVDPSCPECRLTYEDVRAALAPLGIRVREAPSDDPYLDLYTGRSDFDMIAVPWTTVDFPDGATFLSQLMGGDIPSDWLPGGVLSSVQGLQGMPAGQREDATRELGERLTLEIVPAVAYARERTSAFFSPRLGCRSFPPFGFGVDLAALCIVDATA
jgi:peptide/nickel transport system substrate-binding protein